MKEAPMRSEVILCAAMFVGCAAQPFIEKVVDVPLERITMNQDAIEQAVDVYRLIGVPFFPDNTDQCGPATLASVLTFWGAPTDPLALKEDVYLKKLRGSLATDLLLTAQARGFEAELYPADLNDIKSELKAGHPVVTLLNLGYFLFPIGHYVVVTGYDDARRGLYLHSGLQRDVFWPYTKFLRSWEKAGRSILSVVPSGVQKKLS
jgi:hypothetical protein